MAPDRLDGPLLDKSLIVVSTATFSMVTKFSASALTHLLVVTDPQASRDWYVNVLDASVYAEYGGTSVVFELLGKACN